VKKRVPMKHNSVEISEKREMFPVLGKEGHIKRGRFWRREIVMTKDVRGDGEEILGVQARIKKGDIAAKVTLMIWKEFPSGQGLLLYGGGGGCGGGGGVQTVSVLMRKPLSKSLQKEEKEGQL